MMQTKLNATSDLVSSTVPVVVPPVSEVRDAEVNWLQLQLKRMAALSELVARVESADTVTAACQILADQVQIHLSADQVLVGVCRDGRLECKLTAVSGVSTFHARSELAVAAQDALQECIARGKRTAWPPADASRGGGLLAHQQFAQIADAAAIVSAPLHDANGQLRGAWMATGAPGRIHTEKVTGFLQAAETSVGSALHLVTRAQKGPIERVVRDIQRLSKEKRGRAVLAAMVLIALILCIPVHYHAKCDCTVEPIQRRYVAAPFAGPLKKSFVKPGDVVEEGQILAQMDGRELQMELSGTRADLHRATKEHAGHLAIHESGQSAVARYEVDRLQMRTDLLEHRQRNVDIRSPIAGVVVTGDLEDAEGMPLEVGHSLFEIAPLDEMVVEVAIAEDDFASVRIGMPVVIRLDAFPLQRFNASIQRIHPRAELREDANVFIAEVRLEHVRGGLRPGMRGTARIRGDRSPLGWNLFRRPFNAAIAWLGW